MLASRSIFRDAGVVYSGARIITLCGEPVEYIGQYFSKFCIPMLLNIIKIRRKGNTEKLRLAALQSQAARESGLQDVWVHIDRDH